MQTVYWCSRTHPNPVGADGAAWRPVAIGQRLPPFERAVMVEWRLVNRANGGKRVDIGFNSICAQFIGFSHIVD